MIAEPFSETLPNQLTLNESCFTTRVLAHILPTTISPRTESVSTLTQHDTLITYCLVTKMKLKLSSLIINCMIEVSPDSSYLPYGMLLTTLLEASEIKLAKFPSVPITKCYNSRAIKSMGYVLEGDSWVKKDIEVPVPPPSSDIKASASLEPLPSDGDLPTRLTALDAKIDGLKELVLSQYLQLDKIKYITKETGSDIANLRMLSEQTIRDALKTLKNIFFGVDYVVPITAKFVIM
ncbi:uncharacterized protein LOC132032513 [Lycium ferocissimum]|uniref:uncharacterized protein LOC132032513 n=1 Tax=Lycium ferocissimum TaxID=112874 RepID=UPI0028150E51|nr:uncharacterized protein LOC132032513 [Lycium ferocissimum]